MEKKVIYGHLLAFGTIFIWGTTFVSTKVLLSYLTPIEILLCRFLMAYFLLLIISPRDLKPKSIKEEFLFLGLGFTGICSYYLLENIALKFTLVSNVGFYMSTTPIITSMLVTFILKEEKFRNGLIIGFLIAIVGVYLIMFNGGTAFKINLRGDILALLASISFSVYSMLLRKVKKSKNILYVTRKVFFYGIIFMIPIFLTESHQFSKQTCLIPQVHLNLLFLGIMASGLCFLMWNLSVSYIGAIKASIYIYLVPVITALCSVLILNEQLTIPILIGGALILIGAIYSEKGFEIQINRKSKSGCTNTCCHQC